MGFHITRVFGFLWGAKKFWPGSFCCFYVAKSCLWFLFAVVRTNLETSFVTSLFKTAFFAFLCCSASLDIPDVSSVGFR